MFQRFLETSLMERTVRQYNKRRLPPRHWPFKVFRQFFWVLETSNRLADDSTHGAAFWRRLLQKAFCVIPFFGAFSFGGFSHYLLIVGLRTMFGLGFGLGRDLPIVWEFESSCVIPRKFCVCQINCDHNTQRLRYSLLQCVSLFAFATWWNSTIKRH